MKANFFMFRNSAGFTLLELVIVILVIAILVAVALPQYQRTVAKSRYKSMFPIAKAIEVDGSEYVVSEKMVEGVSQNSFICYSKTSGSFASDEIYIHDKIGFAGDMYSWDGLSGSNISFRRGTVAKIDSKRIFFDDGSAYFLSTSGCNYKIYNERGWFEQGSAQDFLQGRDIIYVLNTSQQTVVAVLYMT